MSKIDTLTRHKIPKFFLKAIEDNSLQLQGSSSMLLSIEMEDSICELIIMLKALHISPLCVSLDLSPISPRPNPFRLEGFFEDLEAIQSQENWKCVLPWNNSLHQSQLDLPDLQPAYGVIEVFGKEKVKAITAVVPTKSEIARACKRPVQISHHHEPPTKIPRFDGSCISESTISEDSNIYLKQRSFFKAEVDQLDDTDTEKTSSSISSTNGKSQHCSSDTANYGDDEYNGQYEDDCAGYDTESRRHDGFPFHPKFEEHSDLLFSSNVWQNNYWSSPD